MWRWYYRNNGGYIETTCDTAEMILSVGSPSPVERIDIFNGSSPVYTYRPFPSGDPGRRIKIIWKGAEYRGRGRETQWDGSAVLSGNTFEEIRPVNFWDPEKLPELQNEKTVSWESLTTGGIAGIDILLHKTERGSISITTPLVKEKIEIADIDETGFVFDAGGLSRSLHVYRIPEKNDCYNVEYSKKTILQEGKDNPLFVRITTEDGNIAWSNPVYLQVRS